jgi:cytidine deaminase
MERIVGEEDLLAAASAVREHAYAPFSRFPVGAAIRTDDGRVFVGANVENSTYSATVCAERAAVAAAVAAGARRVTACAVVADHVPPARPCGVCLQTLAEFAGPETPIVLQNLSGEVASLRLGDLLPQPFRF